MLRSIWYREVGHRVSSSARGLSVGKVCEKNYGNITTQSLKEWGADFKRATVDLALMDVNQISYEESSQRLRSLLRSGLLKHTDLLYNPERFFLAHRILAEHATQLGPGFWIRFTVHYNLCMGSILGLGNSEQVKLLDKYQEGGLLGCFSLTEKFAGVNSGMVVNTIAEYSKTRGTFTLRSPEEGAKKNWISQGLVADMTVAVADLHIEGNSFGPHAFLVEMRRDGQLSAGITVGDMGKKTVGNDLDNAWISFNNVELPKSALLNRFGDIDDHGQYVQKVKGMPVFHMIGQRLFTGRVAVAQAAYEFRRKLFETTRAYTDTKRVWSPSGPDHIYLSTIPQVKALYEEEKLKGQKTMAFLDKCEAELCTALRSNNLPSIELVQAIAVAKVLAVEEPISLCHRLRNEVGSYALMARNGFEQTDFLQACKFAEGDSRILMMKMSRDRLRAFEKGSVQKTIGEEDEEKVLCMRIQTAIKAAMSEGVDKHRAMDDQWKDMYALAAVIMDNTLRSFMQPKQT